MTEGWKRVPKNHSGECGHGCPCVTRGPLFSVRLGRDRVDTCWEFECRRCLRLLHSGHHAPRSIFNPHRDLCDACMTHIRNHASRKIAPPNDESKRFACLNSKVLYRQSGLREAFLGDGSVWSETWTIHGRVKEWICTQGPQ